jgi:hypothetical protein
MIKNKHIPFWRGLFLPKEFWDNHPKEDKKGTFQAVVQRLTAISSRDIVTHDCSSVFEAYYMAYKLSKKYYKKEYIRTKTTMSMYEPEWGAEEYPNTIEIMGVYREISI